MRENSETLYGLSFNLTKKKTKAISVLMHTASQEPQAICLEGNRHFFFIYFFFIWAIRNGVCFKHPPHKRTKNSTINTRTALNRWLIRMITGRCCFYERCDILKGEKKVLPSELCTTVKTNTRPQRTKDFHSEHPMLALTGLAAFHMSGSKSL